MRAFTVTTLLLCVTTGMVLGNNFSSPVLMPGLDGDIINIDVVHQGPDLPPRVVQYDVASVLHSLQRLLGDLMGWHAPLVVQDQRDSFNV